MKIKVLLVFLLVLHLCFLMLFRFTAWPELVSFPYLLTRGYSLYGDMVHVYPPLLTYILAFIYKVFGSSLAVLQIFSWFLVLVNDLLIYLISLKLTNTKNLSAAAIILYIPLHISLEGNMLWFDSFMLTPMLLSFYFMLKKNKFAAFFWWSMAILSKQTALLFAPLYVFFLLHPKPNQKSITQALLGLMPVCVFVIYLLIRGSLVWFLNWNFIYPSLFWKDYPGYYHLTLNKREILTIISLIAPMLLGIKTMAKNLYLIGFLFISFIAFFPRFSFFHLQLFIALVVIGSVYAISKSRYLMLISIVLAILIVWLRLPNLKWDWQESPRFFEENTLAKAYEIKNEIGEKSVYFLNLPSQYYVLTNTYPPKPWVDNYGWYWEVPGFQNRTLDRWRENPPQYVLGHNGGYEPMAVTSWIRANYNSIEKEDYTIWQKKEN